MSRAREATRIVRSNVLPARRIGASISPGVRGVVVLASTAASEPSCRGVSSLLVVVASLTREGLFLFRSCKLNQAESSAATNLETASRPLYHLLNRGFLPSTILQR